MPTLSSPSLIRQSPLQATSDSRIWTPLSDPTVAPHFSSVRRARAVLLSRQLAVSSPIYARLLSAFVDLIAPPELQLIVPEDLDNALGPPLDWIWFTGPSALFSNIRDLTTTLLIDGELLLPARVNEADGRLTLSRIDPETIFDFKIAEGLSKIVEVSAPDLDGHPVVYPIINRKPDGSLTMNDSVEPNPPDNPSGFSYPNNGSTKSEPIEKSSQEAFYFRIFPAGYSAGMRGLPLLTALLDDSASLTELMYNRVSRLGNIATHYWDVTLNGSNQNMVDEWLQSQNSTPPESGQVSAHNENVSWKLVQGEIKTFEKELEFFVDFIAGTSGLAPEFIGRLLSRDLTTESMFAVTSHLAALRTQIVSMIYQIIEFSLSVSAKRTNKKVPKFEISVKETGSRLTQRQMTAFNALVTALAKAVQIEAMTKETAKQVIDQAMIRNGLTATWVEEKRKVFTPISDSVVIPTRISGI